MKDIVLLKYRIRIILDSIFIFFAKITKTNLSYVGYYQKGILIYGNSKITGEKYVIEKIIKDYIKINPPVFFDVGSNIGTYSLELKNFHPGAKIYAFEPSPITYGKIIEAATTTDINFYNIGLGSMAGEKIIYDYVDKKGSEHASIYKGVFTDLHHSQGPTELKFMNETLDNFCKKNSIDRIDFLKIDTEGSEYDVLKGGVEMLKTNKIGVIQFEFNEMNVISRVFLKDYYSLLNNYDLYRISAKKLIPLPVYKTENEIFKYQNILAINKTK